MRGGVARSGVALCSEAADSCASAFALAAYFRSQFELLLLAISFFALPLLVWQGVAWAKQRKSVNRGDKLFVIKAIMVLLLTAHTVTVPWRIRPSEGHYDSPSGRHPLRKRSAFVGNSWTSSQSCSTGRERISRHNKLAKHLAKALKAAGMHAQTEARECFISEDNAGSKRPADVLSKDLDATAPHGTAMDVGVTHPLIPGSLSRAATTQGSAAEKYAALKVAKSRVDCRAKGYAFMPLVCETFGTWSAEALQTIRTIGERMDVRLNKRRGTSTRQLLQQLSVQLQIGNAEMIATRVASC